MVRPIYLDYNGTTPIDPAVLAAMRPFLEEEFGNPASSHWYGIAPKRAVEKARGQVAGLLGCAPEEIIFTSGGTEANNHAIRGVIEASAAGSHIITSAIEHPAVLQVCRYLESRGVTTTILPVDGHGLVDPADVEAAIRPDTALITIMHSNNEVGALQPIAEIAAIAHRRAILFHSDAAQSPGKIRLDVGELGVDLLSLAGHKLYAPKGVGALFVRQGVHLVPFCHGAGQEMGRRAGTENVAGIVGLGMACEIAGRDLDRNMKQMRSLRDRLYQGLAARLGETIRRNGHPEQRLVNTLSLSFQGLAANHLLEEIGLEVAASAGAACHSDTVEISHVLAAMQVPDEWAAGTLRFTVGRMTTTAEIDRTIAVVSEAATRLRTAAV
ncbi:MAG: cysteine desulfurase family protein [Thermodesulfobacteriota bacterium]